jgi:2-oxoisovalerate dehydrogenase E1 component
MPHDSLVVCNFGDASANHSTALGAMNTARWCAHLRIALPLVFICEDNSVGISVKTPSQWISNAHSGSPDMRYYACDGRDVLDLYRNAVEVDNHVRVTQTPAFVHMKTVRLLGHAGSDVEAMYHSERDIIAAESDDPLLHTARIVLDNNLMSQREVVDLYEGLRDRMMRVALEAVQRPKLTSAHQIKSSIVPPSKVCELPPLPSEVSRHKVFAGLHNQIHRPQHMARLINWALRDLMLRFPNVVAFGEDIAKKGGVYNVTVGLQKRFGTRRIFDTVLDEQSVLGTAIGMAHNGFLPIPEIQFLAYVHNAEDQIRGEAATLPYFSDGQFTNPMVVRIAGLAYQKGFGGHFHNDNSFAVFRDIPGIIIACPSNGADAARMLRRCVIAAAQEQRVVIFLEPIALYMTKDLHQPNDGGWQFDYPAPNEVLEFNDIGVHGNNDELAIVSYGNGYYLSRQAARILEDQHSIKAKVIDLRWIAPLPEEALLQETQNCRHVLIVDECRKTGSLSEALFTLYMECANPLPKLKRVTAEDCYIPLADAANLMLPSRDSIIDGALELVKS